jgi:hypothetical protein
MTTKNLYVKAKKEWIWTQAQQLADDLDISLSAYVTGVLEFHQSLEGRELLRARVLEMADKLVSKTGAE